MPNWNDAPEQREYGAVIPDGTFVRLKMKITPGGITKNGEDPRDNGLFKASTQPGSDVLMLDTSYKVISGPYADREVFQPMTVEGGKLNDKGESIAGNISKGNFRAIMESWHGVRPDDKSPQAQAVRAPPAYSLLQGAEFVARLGVQEGEQKNDGSKYPDKNFIAHVVVPGEPEYDMVRAGQEVAPKPTGVRAARTGPPGGAGGGQGQLWGGQGQPAGGAQWQAQPAPAAPLPPPPQQYAQPAPQQQPQQYAPQPAAAAPATWPPQPGPQPGYAAPAPQPQPVYAPQPGQPAPQQYAPQPQPNGPVPQQPAPGAPQQGQGPSWMTQ